LDILQEHGIAANDIEKLNSAGFYTIESIAHATSRRLSDVKGISEAKVTKLKDLVRSLVPLDFKTAVRVLITRLGTLLLR
jgi:predicted RecB family nuclease